MGTTRTDNNIPLPNASPSYSLCGAVNFFCPEGQPQTWSKHSSELYIACAINFSYPDKKSINLFYFLSVPEAGGVSKNGPVSSNRILTFEDGEYIRYYHYHVPLVSN